ncbi:uncharacterized protein MYCFIDRAFT_210027 [Pseudocercospora fijiensis CIRAD86]|uniref:AA1-like domain-containing protein n=1 Tax=Pseudocercospora fijiensis (strain CIRAD86) TaxID=383855 RepID=N1Q8L6_PSEFD|nr:uncharacterized protein MYCFIDRAFT_210027 [Pseudocercospora fijiensis CIRAD86]EME89235.1 hypothetical protein MYCFIDRAFT_210027 [Pseudocercospora fijiensis CIRAD86]
MYSAAALAALLSLSTLGINALPTAVDNKWTISNVYIGCGNDPAKGGAFCSYEFDVEGKETDDLPGFSGHCSQRNTPGDDSIKQCQLTGGWSSSNPNRSVNSIDASVQLFPNDAQQSKLILQLTWDLKNGANQNHRHLACYPDWQLQVLQRGHHPSARPDPIFLQVLVSGLSVTAFGLATENMRQWRNA